MCRRKAIAGIGLCSLVLLGVLAALAQTAEQPPTELYVRTSPPNAEILVDGKNRGRSPALFAVEPGEHTITVKLEGYGPQTRTVTLREGRIRRVILELQKGPEARNEEPKRGTAQAPWGKPVNGVQVRLRASRAVWSATDVPTFTIDLTSQKERPLPYGPVHDEFEVQFDGRWYRHVGPDIRSLAPAPATSREGIHLALAKRTWLRIPEGLPLDLAPGRHTVRVAFLLADGAGEGREPARALSNAVEIEIMPATAAATSPESPEQIAARQSWEIRAHLQKSAEAGAAHLRDFLSARQPMASPRKLVSIALGEDVGVVEVAFSPSGKTVATLDETGQVRLRNARAGTETLSFNLLGERERVAIFRSAKRQRILTGGIAFSPDGATLAVGGGPVVKLYDVADGRLDLRFEDRRLVGTPAGKEGPSPPAPVPAGGKRGEGLGKPPAIPYAHGQVFCVAFSPDGKLLATSGDVIREVGEDTGATGGKVKLWDPKTGELRRDLGEWNGAVRSVAFSPDGKTLASIGTHPPAGQTSVRLWDPQTGTVKSVLPIARGGVPWSVAFSPDGKLVAASALVHEDDRDGRQGERGCKLFVWNAQTGAPLCNRSVPGLAQLSFSADSKTLATGIDGQGVILWAPKALAKREIEPSTHRPRDVHVAFAPTGNLLAVAGKDAKQGGFITVWEIAGVKDQPGQAERR